jgi:hypothetical protein
MTVKPMNPSSRLFRELTPSQIDKRHRAAEQPPPKPQRPKPPMRRPKPPAVEC